MKKDKNNGSESDSNYEAFSSDILNPGTITQNSVLLKRTNQSIMSGTESLDISNAKKTKFDDSNYDESDQELEFDTKSLVSEDDDDKGDDLLDRENCKPSMRLNL